MSAVRALRLSPIDDLDALIARAQARPESARSRLHGVHHWQCVAWTGLQLLAEADADPWVVFLFALLHDSQRASDGHDPLHGRRAGEFARTLNGDLFSLSGDRLELLVEACNLHSDGLVSTEPTIGVCWDADRLNLWRVGQQPEPRFLSNPMARTTRDWVDGSRSLQSQRFEWSDIYARYLAAARAG
jgi:uncharacterized protein